MLVSQCSKNIAPARILDDMSPSAVGAQTHNAAMLVTQCSKSIAPMRILDDMSPSAVGAPTLFSRTQCSDVGVTVLQKHRPNENSGWHVPHQQLVHLPSSHKHNAAMLMSQCSKCIAPMGILDDMFPSAVGAPTLFSRTQCSNVGVTVLQMHSPNGNSG